MLGFDSKIGPNTYIFNISGVSLRKTQRFRVFRDICVDTCTLLCAIPEYSGKDANFIRLGLFLFQKCLDTAGCTAFIEEYPKYSHYLGLSIILFLDLDGEENP